MIARIKTENGFYDSTVFAILNDGWKKSKVLVFSQDFTALQTVDMYSIKKGYHVNVFVYNTEKGNNWVCDKKAEGYDWALKILAPKFSITQTVGSDILEKCRTLQATVKDFDWSEIKTEADIDGLMWASFGFHDSYVKDIYIRDGKQYILFDTTWDCEILFELDGNFETNLFKDYGHIAIGNDYPLISDSSMFFESNLIYWVDEDGIKSSSDFDKEDFRYFCANRVKWKLIV